MEYGLVLVELDGDVAHLGRLGEVPNQEEAAISQLSESRGLWNRSSLDLRSDEILAQIIDRGSLGDWRALFELARGDPTLRHRIAALVARVPLPLPDFWLAALRSLGEDVDVGQATPPYDGTST